MPHDDAQAPAPAFRQADPCAFQFDREKTQKSVRGRMEAKRRSNEIDEWRSGLQFDSRKISVASKIPLLEMTAYAKPVAGGLQREMNVLARFKLEDGETSGASDREEIENAVLAAGMREHLRINEARVESSIDAGDVFANQSFEPALWLRAIESMARFGGERMAMIFKLLEQILQRWQRRRMEFFAGVGTAKEDAAIVPTSKRETRKRSHTSRDCATGWMVTARGERATTGSSAEREASRSACDSRWGTSQVS